VIDPVLWSKDGSIRPFRDWVGHADAVGPACDDDKLALLSAEALEDRVAGLSRRPLIVLGMAVGAETRPEHLKATLQSLCHQAYPIWRLVVLVLPDATYHARELLRAATFAEPRIAAETIMLGAVVDQYLDAAATDMGGALRPGLVLARTALLHGVARCGFGLYRRHHSGRRRYADHCHSRRGRHRFRGGP